MTDNTQPEALRLAEQYDHGDPATHGNAWKAAICAELRRQHARIAELESELEAVGAGGVSGPLMGIAAPPTAQALGCGAEPPGIQALMCVISSLRDTAHFCDEEGKLTNDLRTLRDWAYAQTAAFQPPPTSAKGVEHG